MKKFVIPILVLALTAALLLPPVFGRMIEAAVKARVAALDEAGTLEVDIESFDRGWFSSRALLEFVPTTPAAAGLTASWPAHVVVNFDHGPVSLRDGFFFGFARLTARPAAAAGGAEAGDGARPGGSATRDFGFEARTTLGGDVHFAATLPAIDYAAAGETLSFSGGRVVGSLEGRRFTAEGRAETLQYRGPRATLSLQGIEVAADNEVLSELRLPGTVDLQVARAAVELPGADSLFDAAGVSLRSTLSLDEAADLMDGELEVTTDTIRSGADTHITHSRLKTLARRVDVAALEEYSQTAARLAENGTRGAAAAEALEPSVKRLLAAGPTLVVTPLAFDVNGEPFQAELTAAAQPGALTTPAPVDIGDSDFWKRILDVRAELTAAKSLIQSATTAIIRRRAEQAAADGGAVPFGNADTADVQASLLLAVLATQGVLEDTGSQYRTTVQVEDGRVTVNGKRLPFLSL